jgi:MYXO-CTERM domain-containing protein
MLPTPNVQNAQYVISPTDTRFGPHDMVESIRHPSAVSTWLPDSRLCGTCHNITNPAQPLRRANGTDTGQRFPLDTTYSEWVQSDYGRAGSADARSCQDCHMPRSPMAGYTASTSGALERAAPRRHTFAGANIWGLQVMQSLRNDMRSGSFYDPEQAGLFTTGIRNAEASLRSAVTLEWRSPPSSAAPGARIEVVARITNRSGHRVPTGYADGRRVWLEVALIDAAGAETVLSGAYDNAEAHLDERDTQLKLYETLHGRIGIGPEEHIALHDTIVKDTRIPPKGYRPLPGHEPVGVDYAGGENGTLRHWDDARYMVTIPATARGSLRLRVRARYQSTTRHYVEFLANENRTDDRGRELLRLYNATGRAAPFNMAEATTTIMVTGTTAQDGGVGDAATMPAEAGGGCQLSVQGRPTQRHAAWVFAALAAFVATRRRRAVR